MKMNEKKRAALYGAIHDPILNLRIALKEGRVKDIDNRLFHIVDWIWREQFKVLNLEGSP